MRNDSQQPPPGSDWLATPRGDTAPLISFTSGYRRPGRPATPEELAAEDARAREHMSGLNLPATWFDSEDD